jgi:hypothetical protein
VNLVIHFSEGLEDQERGSDAQVVVAPLLFGCAKTVSELHAFQSLELLFERKQIPQIVVNVRSLRKTTEPLEITRVPWAQGVGRSNRPAPTNKIKGSVRFPKAAPQGAVALGGRSRSYRHGAAQPMSSTGTEPTALCLN